MCLQNIGSLPTVYFKVIYFLHGFVKIQLIYINRPTNCQSLCEFVYDLI